MLDQLAAAGYRGPLGIRLNPGFGHGHVQSCDTGGPSSKHGIWFDEALTVAHAATRHGMTVTLLHAHIGSGPAVAEFTDNMQHLANFFAECLEAYPHVQAVNFGVAFRIPIAQEPQRRSRKPSGISCRQPRCASASQTGRAIRVEIEPGRYFVAPGRMRDHPRHRCEADQSQYQRDQSQTFVMVDAGFVI